MKRVVEDIKKVCEYYDIIDYNINSDGSIDVFETVDLSFRGLCELPLNFRSVNGNFNCMSNKLTSLRGCPKSVNGYFSCSSNELTSLEFAPKKVSGDFYCYSNPLNTNYCDVDLIGGFHTSTFESGLDISNNDVALNYNEWRLKAKRHKIIKFLNEVYNNTNGDIE